MMAGEQTKSATSTWAIVLTALAGASTLFGYAGAVATLIVLAIPLSIAGLVTGIVAKREAAITVSAVALIVSLAVGLGFMSFPA